MKTNRKCYVKLENGDYVYVVGDNASVKEYRLVESDGNIFKIEHRGEYCQYDKDKVFENIDDCIYYMRKNLKLNEDHYTVYSYYPF